MQQRLGLRVTAEPVFTQSLHQLVNLLALNKLDLKAKINQELSENPLLELGEPAEDDPEEFDASSEAALDEEHGTSDSAGESVVSEGTDEPISEVGDGALGEIDLDAFFDGYPDPGSMALAGKGVERPSLEAFLAEPLTLRNHLEGQLRMSHVSESVRAAAESVLGNLNEDGYLTASLEEVRETAAVTPEDAQAALELVQAFDPPGVAARDLQECLLIQLRESEPGGGIATTIVKEFFAELQNKEYTAIAGKTGVSLDEVKRGVS